MIQYLSGIQQSRAELRPEKIVKTVYGILTDGLEFRFFRLDSEDHLYISKLFAADFEDESKDYRSIDPAEQYGTDFTARYRFIDTIFEAAIKSSPHTIPAKTLPGTTLKWNKSIGLSRGPEILGPTRRTWVLSEKDFDKRPRSADSAQGRRAGNGRLEKRTGSVKGEGIRLERWATNTQASDFDGVIPGGQTPETTGGHQRLKNPRTEQGVLKDKSKCRPEPVQLAHVAVVPEMDAVDPRIMGGRIGWKTATEPPGPPTRYYRERPILFLNSPSRAKLHGPSLSLRTAEGRQ